MPNAISYERVLQIARSLGFSLSKNAVGPALVYRSSLGIVREFTVPWLQQGKFYPDDQVRSQLEGMHKSAKAEDDIVIFLKNQSNVDAINEACFEFGMVYDQEDRRFYYVVNHVALFGLDHDYIASLLLTKSASVMDLMCADSKDGKLPAMNMGNSKEVIKTAVKSILAAHKMDAEESRKNIRAASGEDLVGKPIKGTLKKKPEPTKVATPAKKGTNAKSANKKKKK